MKKITFIMALFVSSLSFGQIIADGGFETMGAAGATEVEEGGTGPAVKETGFWIATSPGFAERCTVVSSNPDVGTYALQVDSSVGAAKVNQNVILDANTTYTCSYRVRKVNDNVGDDEKVLVFKVLTNAGNAIQTATDGAGGYLDNGAFKIKRSTLSTTEYNSASFEFTTGDATDYYLAIALQHEKDGDPDGSPVVLDEISIIAGALSNKEFKADNNFSFAPNPTNNFVNLSASKNIEKVEFYNLLGQNALSAPVNGLRKEVNISNLKSGIYLMKVTIDNVVGTYKIIKE
jgi:hypothetical protein